MIKTESDNVGFQSFKIDVKKLQKKSQSNVSDSKKRRFKWNQMETAAYCLFIIGNQQILGKEFKRQKQKIFNRMASVVKTRTSRQCKSHHQKMLMKYKEISRIIEKLTIDMPKNVEQISHQNDSKTKENISVQTNLSKSADDQTYVLAVEKKLDSKPFENSSNILPQSHLTSVIKINSLPFFVPKIVKETKSQSGTDCRVENQKCRQIAEEPIYIDDELISQ